MASLKSDGEILQTSFASGAPGQDHAISEMPGLRIHCLVTELTRVVSKCQTFMSETAVIKPLQGGVPDALMHTFNVFFD